MKVKKLTNRNADSLKPPKGLTESGRPKLTAYYRDTELRGFALRVSAAGGRTWIVEYSLKGHQFSHVIGKRELFTAARARNEARKLLGKVAGGSNPLSEKQKGKDADAERRRAATFGELYDAWLEKGGKRGEGGKEKKSAAHDRSARKKFASFENKRAREITTEQIESILTGLKDTPIAANRALALIKTVCRWGERKHHLESDPAKGIERPYDEAYRIVDPPTPDELDAFYAALDAHSDQTGANAIRLVLWTGSRLREILWAKWRDIDLVNATLHKRETKSGPVIVPLNRLALDLLCEMKRTATSEWVFPSRTAHDRPRWDVDNVWHPVRKAIGRDTMTVHDHRHWFATTLLNKGGIPTHLIAPLLGHRSSAITSRYAHLQVGTLRVETERAMLALAPPAPRKLIAPPTSKRGRKAVAR